MPQNDAGWRIEPPVSVPVERATWPEATEAAEPPLELRGRHGVAEIIALAFFAASARQQIGGGAALDAFGNDRQAEQLAQANGGADDRHVVRVRHQFADEGLIDFQPVERIGADPGRARLAQTGAQ